MNGKVAPNAIDAEKALLASIMLDHEALYEIPHVPVAAFYSERHRVIFRAIQDLDSQGVPPDLPAIINALRDAKTLDTSGGMAYLTGLWDVEPTGAYAKHYANIVLEKYRLRQLISITGKALEDGYNNAAFEGVMSELELSLTNLARFDSVERGPDDYQRDALELAEGVGGLSTGLVDLDHATGGLVKGGFNVIAARPSQGKSSVMRAMLQHRVKEGDRVALFSIDQSGGEIYGLTAAAMIGMGLSTLRSRGTEHDLAKFQKALEDIKRRWADRFIINDTKSDLGSILQAARREIRNGATVIAVDHLQAVGVDGKTDDAGLVANVSRSFKSLAREFNVTVLLLSQLGRGVETRADKRPMLSDLRQSGAIEEDANQVLFLYRDAYYNTALNNPERGKMEIIVAKNKLGEVPLTVPVRWESELATVRNLASRDYSRYDS